MKKVKKVDIFKLLDRDCVSPVTREYIKEYINYLIQQREEIKRVRRKI